LPSGLWIGILGPLVVARDGVELPALPPGQRVVLGLLAQAAGAPVQRDAIVDALWGQEPPRSSAEIVQTYISRLRSRLPDGLEYLPETDGSGYRLVLAPEQLDLLMFRRLVKRARTAAVADPGEAFEQALGLWRGQPLADVSSLQYHPAVSALAAEHTAVVLDYADTGAAGDRVVPHLQTLITWDPLNEGANARLMIALASADRQADALRAYEQVRRRLDEELGVLPGPALRAAHVRVLRQDIPAGRPVDAWQPVCQLPAAPADFTGRAAECADLIGAIDACDDHPGVPVVAISGQPGIGKTSLALHAVHKIRDRFPDGQLWVQLAGASARPRDPGEVLGEVLRALGLPGSAIPEDYAERAVCYRSHLAGRRIVVVADDAATAAQVRPLIPGTSGCALIVTSRSRIEDLAGARLMPLEVLPPDDAAGLLSRIVGAGRVAAELDATGELVAACGALPLALRIAGAKLAARPSWPLATMVRRLASKHDRLRELEVGDLSVRASIASSYESLPERPRRAFRLLALLGPGDFAEWVVGALLGEPDAWDVTSELVSRSLLTPLSADATGEPRYRLHDILRDFASEQLAAAPDDEGDSALGRVLAAWLQLASLADSLLPPEPYFPPLDLVEVVDVLPGDEAGRLTADPVAWFAAERGNLLTAVEQACMSGRAEVGYWLALRQCAFQHIQQRYEDAGRIWRLIAAGAASLRDQAGNVYASLRIGASMIERGQSVEAFEVLDRCVQAASSMGESETLSLALYWRSACAFDLDDQSRSLADAEWGVSVARAAGSQLAELMNLRLRSSTLAWLGADDRAVADSELAIAIASDLGDTYELAALHNLAYTLTLTGRYERAVSVCLREMELSRKLMDVRGEAISYAVLGDAYQGMGKYDLAVDNLLRALPAFRDHNFPRHHAVCLYKLGRAHEELERYHEAVSYLEDSLVNFRQLRLPQRVEETQRSLDRCRAALAAAG
jgi:DNA-binding SARP family transcriptional activator/tetratricopeptide (TPR) repeat protein